MIDAERFWRHCMVLDDSENTCWIWVGALRDDGRGRAWKHGKEVAAHRLAYELQNGQPPPEGYRLEQMCNQPQCVRHWQVAGRFRKVSPADALSISRSSMPGRALARMYGIGETQVRRIRSYLRRGGPGA